MCRKGQKPEQNAWHFRVTINMSIRLVIKIEITFESPDI